AGPQRHPLPHPNGRLRAGEARSPTGPPLDRKPAVRQLSRNAHRGLPPQTTSPRWTSASTTTRPRNFQPTTSAGQDRAAVTAREWQVSELVTIPFCDAAQNSDEFCDGRPGSKSRLRAFVQNIGQGTTPALRHRLRIAVRKQADDLPFTRLESQ